MANCVTKETELLTAKGYVPIGALENQRVWVWNGAEYCGAMVRKTGTNEKLVRVWFEDGAYIDCSELHAFCIENNETMPAIGLRSGQRLATYTHPQVQLESDLKVSQEIAYVSGYATFAGYEDNNRLALATPPDISDAMFKRLVTPSVDISLALESSGQIRYEPKTIKAGYAPLRWKSTSRLSWLAGAMDAAGDWLDVEGSWWLVLGSTDEQLIREMRRVGLECALTPRIRVTDTLNAFMLDAYDANLLTTLDYMLGHEKKPQEMTVKNQDISPVVADVHPLPWRADVYCAWEPKTRRIVCNGIMIGSVL